MLAVAIAIVRSDDVVIADDKSRPARGGIDGCDLLAEFGGRKAVDCGEEKIHGQLKFVVTLPVVAVQFIDVGGPGFADQNCVAFVGDFAQSTQRFMDFR